MSDMVKQLLQGYEKFIGQTGSKITQIEGSVAALTKQVAMLEDQVGHISCYVSRILFE